MSQLVKATEERGYRARADRRIYSGRVLWVDPSTNDMLIDVGAFDAQGNPLYLHNVPNDPHTPYQVQDIVSIGYHNVSPHSLTIGGASLGGANAGRVVRGPYVVSISKSGSALLQGDVTFTASGDLTLTQAGQNLDYAITIPPQQTKVVGEISYTDGPIQLFAGRRLEWYRNADIFSIQEKKPLWIVLGAQYDFVAAAGTNLTTFVPTEPALNGSWVREDFATIGWPATLPVGYQLIVSNANRIRSNNFAADQIIYGKLMPNPLTREIAVEARVYVADLSVRDPSGYYGTVELIACCDPNVVPVSHILPSFQLICDVHPDGSVGVSLRGDYDFSATGQLLPPGSWSPGETHTLRLECYEGQQYGFVDGEMVASLEVGPGYYGYAGFGMWSSMTDTTGVHLENFYIYGPIGTRYIVDGSAGNVNLGGMENQLAYEVELGDTYTLTLVEAQSATFPVMVRGLGAVCTITALPSNTIDGLPSITIGDNDCIIITSDGNNWYTKFVSFGNNNSNYRDASVPGGNTIANTAVQTNFASQYALLANSLKVGDVIRITAYGNYGTLVAVPGTLTFKLVANATVIGATGALPLVAALVGNEWKAEALITITALGAGGTMEVQGLIHAITGIGTALIDGITNLAAVAIDTTIGETFHLAVQFSVANPANTITLREFFVERIGI